LTNLQLVKISDYWEDVLMAVMEVTRLRVAAENAPALQDARAGMVRAFAERPGFVQASLVRLAADEWLDLIVWQTSADFAESRRRGADSAEVRAFFGAIAEVISSEEGVLWEP
jgi:heme-degrading monooxygenase HmoA